LRLWGRHVGAGLPESISPTVDELPGADEDPATGFGLSFSRLGGSIRSGSLAAADAPLILVKNG
jgi:hypothetical protein